MEVTLTQELVDRYVGGQLEVLNRYESYIARGEITAVALTNNNDSQYVTVTLEWYARLTGTSRWELIEPKPYRVSLKVFTPSDIGDGRVYLTSDLESAVLYPPGGSKLDPHTGRIDVGRPSLVGAH